MSDIPDTPGPFASDLAPLSGSSLRKERGAIAAQACDTCRSRKQRCDEQRPKCSTCQKFKLECNYREPQPTKKDKTLVEILDRIKNLEGKIDSLGLRSGYTLSPILPGPFPTTLAPSTPIATGPGNFAPLSASSFQLHETSSAASGDEDHFIYGSSVHQMLAWPAVQQLLAAVQPKVSGFDMSAVERDGPATVLGLLNPAGQGLPVDTNFTSVAQTSSLNSHGPASASIPMALSGMNWDTMQRLSKAYFDSFNLLCPILDRHSFMSNTLPSVYNHGAGQDVTSAIVFLVLALGEVALAGSEGPPVHMYNGRPSGVKGGTKDQPPGLGLFNEARKRMGFNLTECSLENTQIFSLASIYYGACFRPLDLWRMVTSTSLACQALITSNPTELSSPRADLIRRTFWHCSIMETCLHLEFGFPLTGLEKMEAMVGLPDFSGPFSDEDYINEESHYQEHFASQIVLRRLLVEFNGVLTQTSMFDPTLGPLQPPFSPLTAGTALTQSTLHHLAMQLEKWRGVLPVHLGWEEDSPGAFPTTSPDMYSPAVFTNAAPISSAIPAPGQVSASPLMFTTDLDALPVRYPYGLDIQVSLLRSRYYYTKLLIHRPYMYKALHFPDAMTHDDALGVAECLKAGLKWPVAMSPTCTHKRLVPCIFFFTQNLFGILVMLRLSTTVPILRRIRSTLCGERFEMDARETVGLYLDWLRDLKAVDNAAAWQWDVVKALYGLED